MNVLELYSGIGGMHFALKASGVEYTVKASIEINPIANSVNSHNFPDTKIINRNIESLSAKFINDLQVDTILMSPPCQPFTRNGLKGDIDDNRTESFRHLVNILPELSVERILVENVVGFERSQMRDRLLACLEETGFVWQEFILCPTQFGVPNSRKRYYCLATRRSAGLKFERGPLMNSMPTGFVWCYLWMPKIFVYLENPQNVENYVIEENILRKHLNVTDVCYRDSIRSCCFTKSYGRFLEGTGSVYCDKLESEAKELLEEQKREKNFNKLGELNLRFFTPKEIANLMCFPSDFSFPTTLTDKQKYKLLGNSINITVVSELIKLFAD